MVKHGFQFAIIVGVLATVYDAVAHFVLDSLGTFGEATVTFGDVAIIWYYIPKILIFAGVVFFLSKRFKRDAVFLSAIATASFFVFYLVTAGIYFDVTGSQADAILSVLHFAWFYIAFAITAPFVLKRLKI